MTNLKYIYHTELFIVKALGPMCDFTQSPLERTGPYVYFYNMWPQPQKQCCGPTTTTGLRVTTVVKPMNSQILLLENLTSES